jgi:hypothetical protein
MKVTNKFLSVLFAAMIMVSLFACTPAATATEAPTAAPVVSTEAPVTEAPADPSLLTADGRYPVEPVKICVETFDPADTQYQDVQKYFESLSQNVFNVEFTYSEKIESAEQELQFIENCAAAGGKGLIAYYNVSKGQAVAKAAELGVYYWGLGDDPEVYPEYQSNPYFLGNVVNGNADYEGMYSVTKAILAMGKTKLIYANGGADFGIPFFVNRKAGFQAAIDEAKAAGTEITVTEVPGFPNEAWFAAQGAALAGDVDAVVTSFGADVWVQPIAASGKTGIAIGSFGAISDFYKQTFADGSVSAIVAEPTERFGLGVAQIINAVDGNADALEENGMATNAVQSVWVVTNADQFNTLYDYEHGNGRVEFSKRLPELIVKLNPGASIDTLKELIQAYTLETITSK